MTATGFWLIDPATIVRTPEQEARNAAEAAWHAEWQARWPGTVAEKRAELVAQAEALGWPRVHVKNSLGGFSGFRGWVKGEAAWRAVIADAQVSDHHAGGMDTLHDIYFALRDHVDRMRRRMAEGAA